MQLTNFSWPKIQALGKNIPIVFPVAALEQHGRHLPVFTDSMLLGEIVRRTEEKLADRVLFAPLLWLGNSEHHMEFPGTLSAPPRTYLDMLAGMMENFIAHGFRRLVFINGHGGNDVPGRQVVFEVRQRHRQRRDLLLLFATYWNLGAKPQHVRKDLKQPRMGHACEWETSMILKLAPHLVGDFRRAPDVEFGEVFEPAARGWITQERTKPGHIGFPRQATAEKGEALFEIFSDDVIAFMKKVIAWDGKSWNG